MESIRLHWLLLTPFLLGACALPERRADFRSVDPQERTLALAQAAQAEDERAIPVLIAMLDSDDAGERMLAIRTLERMTGQTFGYDYAAPPAQREPAVQDWVRWQRSRGSGSEG